MSSKQKMIKIKFCTILLFVLLSPLLFSIQACYSNKSDSTNESSHLLDDSSIARAIKTEFLIAPNISADEIDINVINGDATLSGITNNILTKERAIKIAESVTGVKSVINNIAVSESKRSDNEISDDVRVALVNNPATEAYAVNTRVNNGNVTLTGTVQSWQQKDLCTKVAEGVTGVRGVNNKLIISYNAPRPDKDIREDILSRLKWDVYLDQQFIRVKVNNGNVTLGGTVGSAAEKRWAYRDAWVNGVNSVNNSNIKVRWWTKSSSNEKAENEILRDEEIKTALEQSFSLDPRVLSYKINAKVANGTVILKGTVASLQEKFAAEKDAKKTTGVTKVNNQLKVKINSPLPDSVISARVSEALMRNPYFDKYKIYVTADNGKIYLTGTVNNEFEKSTATQITASVKGVTSVKNDLIYQASEAEVKSDKVIKKNIEQQLYRDPVTNSRKIKVEVKNGKAILTGYVATRLEKNVASVEAYRGGAKNVDNEIGII